MEEGGEHRSLWRARASVGGGGEGRAAPLGRICFISTYR